VICCWGQNESGQLGDGTFVQRLAPVQVKGGRLFPRLSAGDTHSCGLTPERLAYCWGNGRSGALGDGLASRRFVPAPVAGGLRFINGLNAGYRRTCGVTTGNVAYCWGNNDFGALGNGDSQDRLTPTRVAGNLPFEGLATNTRLGTTCGVTTEKRAYCWGNNSAGQVGNGRHSDSPLTPTAVVGPA
jgi:alpha-tubulin suppressor-like RCC1 family protein